MSERSSTPPNAREASSSPPMSRPPPLQSRWGAHQGGVAPFPSRTGGGPLEAATATTAPSGGSEAAAAVTLTSPVTGIASGGTPVKNAVVTHHLSKLAGARSGGVRVNGTGIGNLVGSARGRPQGESRPGWDFTTGEDTELQQIAGDIPAPGQKAAPQQQQPTSGQGSVATAAPVPPSVVAEAAEEGGSSAVMATDGRGSSSAPAPNVSCSTGDVLASVAVVRGSGVGGSGGGGVATLPIRQRASSTSPLGPGAPLVVRPTQSPNHVRTSPYQHGALLQSVGPALESAAAVNVVFRQRQGSPLSNVYVNNSGNCGGPTASAAGSQGPAAANPGTGGESCGPAAWYSISSTPQRQQQQQHLSESDPTGGGDAPFGPTVAATHPAAAAAGGSGSGGGSGLEAGSRPLMPTAAQRQDHRYRNPQPTTEADEVTATAVTAAAAAVGGGVPSHSYGAAAVRGAAVAKPGKAKATPVVSTSTGAAGTGQPLSPDPPMPPGMANAAAATAPTTSSPKGRHAAVAAVPTAGSIPSQHQQQQPTVQAGATAATAPPQLRPPPTPNRDESLPVADPVTDSPMPVLGVVAKPFTDAQRLAALAEVRKLECHLFYPNARIPDECLNKGDTEANQRRLEQRRKQIMYGKDTDGYRTYTRVVPHVALREFHNPMHPITPRPENDCSKRAFDKHLNTWRRQLHQWDDYRPDSPNPLFRPLGVATLADLGLADRPVTPVPRPLSTTSGLPVHQHLHHMHTNIPKATMQSIASLATAVAAPAGAMGGPGAGTAGVQALSGQKPGRSLHSPALGQGGGPSLSFGSFRHDSAGANNGSNGMTTPLHRLPSGGGRLSSTTDCPTPNIMFSFQRTASGAVTSPSVPNPGAGNSTSGQSGRGLSALAASTPYRPQSADGPELDSNFFNGSGLLSMGSRGSRMGSPIAFSAAQVEFGRPSQMYGYGPYPPFTTTAGNNSNNNNNNNSSPFTRTTPFGGNGRSPAQNRPSSTTADRTPTYYASSSPYLAHGYGDGAVMKRVLDFTLELPPDSTRASPAGYNGHGGGYYGGWGGNGLVPIPHNSPYRRMDSSGNGAGSLSSAVGGAGLIPSTVVAPQLPHPQQPQQHTSPAHGGKDAAGNNGNMSSGGYHGASSCANTPGRIPGYPYVNASHASHATPPNIGQQQQQPMPMAAGGSGGNGNGSGAGLPPEVHLTSGE